MIFVVSLSLYFIAAYPFTNHLGLVSPEATRRAALASLVIAGDVSSLFAASPSAPPLPIILQLPLQLLPLLSTNVMSITLLAVVSGALTCCLTNRILVELNVARNCRYPLVALFALNPGMLAHSSTGSSEVLLLALVVLSAYFLLKWQRTDSVQPIVALGFALGMASLTQYDALAYSVPFLAGVGFLERRAHNNLPGRVQALMIVTGLPIAFTFCGWALVYLLATGELLHFAPGALAWRQGFILIVPLGIIMAGSIVSHLSTMATRRHIAICARCALLVAVAAATLGSGFVAARSLQDSQWTWPHTVGEINLHTAGGVEGWIIDE